MYVSNQETGSIPLGFFSRMEARGRKGKEEKQFDWNITLSPVLKRSGDFEQNGNISYSSRIFVAPDKGWDRQIYNFQFW